MRMAFLVNAREFSADVDRAGKQLKFALSVGINETTKAAQKAQREAMAQNFTVRRKPWVDRSVKISKFAKKTDLEAELRIQAPGDPSRSDILTQHEKGGTKTPRGRSIAVPVEVRRGKTGVVSKGMRPRALNFEPVGPNVMKGDKRTFLIRKPGGRGVILQRVGSGARAAMRVLFAFLPRAPLKPRLKFEETVVRTVRAEAPKQFRAALAKAMRTARPG